LAHILLVEDDADSRDALQFLLEHSGHRVSVAAGGQEGIALAASHSRARSSGVPWLARSPRVRSITAVRCPSWARRIIVPPANSSTSSGWGPKARTSTP